jgi:hypothetical protein
MAIKALFLNFTLKKLPKVSNTQAPIRSVPIFIEPGVESQMVKVIDYSVAFGSLSDKGDEDENTSGKINVCYIPVTATPILFGVLPSIVTMAIERQGGTYMEGNAKPEKYPNKGRLKDLLLLELKVVHTMDSICDTTWHIFQGCPRKIPSLQIKIFFEGTKKISE